MVFFKIFKRNTKKAAAFSAMSIINSSKDDEEIKKILPTIIPKLYRYIFDPNPTINRFSIF
jgi:proteasome component ECM29